jgi:hypothetical protein
VRYEGSIGELGMGLISVEALGGVREMNSVGIFADLCPFSSVLVSISDLSRFRERIRERRGRNRYLDEL